ncbi:MAG TPA: CoA pyrophosphatase [Gemmatimonadales bacterium]
MLDPLLAALAGHVPQQSDDPSRPRAAVALVLATGPDRLLLIRRAERMGDPWSGHLALPGGRYHADDADLLATAIRETNEETSVHLEREWCRAQLDDLLPRTPTLPPIVVRPFVFFVPEAVAPGVSSEVVYSTWLPLAHLAADGVFRARPVVVRGEQRVEEGYQLPEGFLWGMTERILSPVLMLWKNSGGAD